MNVKKIVSAVLIALSIELAVYAVVMHFLYSRSPKNEMGA